MFVDAAGRFVASGPTGVDAWGGEKVTVACGLRWPEVRVDGLILALTRARYSKYEPNPDPDPDPSPNPNPNADRDPNPSQARGSS